ncbi:MAG TPA: TIGR03067 domain-containing protein [Planctomicrobium sp.]|nr:TIGR03067 domain-containing protein [Planctomicrobium sp.]
MTGTVTAVDADKKAITVGDFTFDVVRKTTLTLDGKQVPLSEIKVGMIASVTYNDYLETAIAVSIDDQGKRVQEKNNQAMKALQGDWICVSAEEMGRPFEKTDLRKQNRHFTVQGNLLTMWWTSAGTEGTYTGRFEINAMTGTFDWIGRGPTGDAAEWIGIYELDDDKLKLCYLHKRDQQAVRPIEFKTNGELRSPGVFYVFKRDAD